MLIRLLVFTAALLLASSVSIPAMQAVPKNLYPALEYALTIPADREKVEPEKLSALVNFVRSAASGSSMTMENRNEATGAFHSFELKGDLGKVARYAYNPDIPGYVVMPSSVMEQTLTTPETAGELRRLHRALDTGEAFVARGSERVTITPDAHTGGYYQYTQDVAVAVFPGPSGPVLVSVSVQVEPSEVGHKGCVVGRDADWNYLYSGEKGLNKTGLGWVDSYMYSAHSALVLVSDTERGVIRAGTFKWLNAGWAGINMVKPAHIVSGIKRFAGDFTLVLEAGGLPSAEELTGLYRSLRADGPEKLRGMIEPHLRALGQSGDSAVKSAPFKKLLQSGEYLDNMTEAEMVNVLMLRHLKKSIGGVRVAGKF